MIRVVRPAAIPAILAQEGAEKAEEHCAAYNGGAREFEFDSAIYGHTSVKQILVEMHHGKCCYCESKVRHTGPGTIDHYRPKAASQQQAGAPYTRPGYYWLAYDWQNLLFECVACNQSYKRSLFPLRDDSRRALSHLHPLNQEQPLLIDPTLEDPGAFISFREEYAFAVGANDRGLATIDVLGLNDREELVEQRRQWIRTLSVLRDITRTLPGSQVAADAQLLLNDVVLDEAEYAAMNRSFLQ